MDIQEFFNEAERDKQVQPILKEIGGKNSIISTKDLTVADVGEDDTNPLQEMANIYSLSRQSVEADAIKKYRRYGINWNPWENLDKQLADAQGGLTQLGHALVQGVGSEVVLGSVKGLFDVIDFVGSNILHLAEANYHNVVSDKIKSWQDAIRDDIAPIYADPDKNIDNGGLTDWGFLMKGLPDVLSTLSLLIPTRAVTGGLSLLGKVGNISGKISKGATKARLWALGVKKAEDAARYSKIRTALSNPYTLAKIKEGTKMFAEGTIMRTMENYGEASDVYSQLYADNLYNYEQLSDEEFAEYVQNNPNLEKLVAEKGVENITRDDVAKHIAKTSADRTFAMDFSNLVFDIIQLHGLKNISPYVKKVRGRKINLANKQSIQDAADLATGKVAEKVKPNIFKRAGKFVWEGAKYNAKTFLEESTEGVEEAINYIAQQEGLTYGKLLAGEYDENRQLQVEKQPDSRTFAGRIFGTWNSMNGSLADYMKNPELHEAAFWGVFGGVMFNVGGSAFNAAKLHFDKKAAKEKRKENGKTGEKIDDTEGFFELMESADVKAGKAAIAKRLTRLNQAKADLAQINDKVDIFAKPDETGKKPLFTGDVATQQEIARQKVISDYYTGITLDALNSGTYELLEEYFQSDEVKNAMVELGIAKKEDIESDTEGILREMREIKDEYYKQTAHVLNQVSAINAERGNDADIPIEYVHLLAANNIYNLMRARKLKKEIDAYEAIANDQANNNYHSNFATSKELINMVALLDYYSKLDTDERELKEALGKDETNYITRNQLSNVQRAKRAVFEQIKTITAKGNNVGDAALFNALKYAKTYTKVNGEYKSNAEAFERDDKEIIAELDGIIGKDTPRMSDDVLTATAKRIESELNAITGENGLANINAALFTSYTTLSFLNLERTRLLAEIPTTRSDIRDAIDYMHNGMNETRVKLIEKARDIIVKALNQYDGVTTEDGQDLMNVVLKLYESDKEGARELAKSLMANTGQSNKVTAEEFLDALDIFNYTKATNDSLYEMFYDIYTNSKKLDKNSDVSTENPDLDTTGESSSTFQNPSQTSQPTIDTQTDNLSTLQSQSPQQAESGQNNDNSIVQNRDTRPQRQVVVILNNRGQIVSIKRRNNSSRETLIAYQTEDGYWEVDLSVLPKGKLLQYKDFLEGDVKLLGENDWRVKENPIIAAKGNGFIIVDRGEIEEVQLANQSTISATTTPVEEMSIAQEDDSSLEEELTPANDAQAAPTNETELSPDIELSDTQVEEGESINSSTGEVESSLNADGTPATLSEIIEATFGMTGVDLFSPSTDLKAVGEQVIQLILTSPDVKTTEEELRPLVEAQIKELEQAIADFNDLTSSVEKDGSMLAFMARFEEPNVNNGVVNFGTTITNIIDAFIQDYTSRVYSPIVNGKQVIYLEEVLRLCNEANKVYTKEFTQKMYDFLSAYFNSPEAKNKYIVSDIKDKNIVGNIASKENNKPINEVIYDRFRINLVRTSPELQEALSKLSNNDTVTLHYDAEKGFVIQAKVNDKTVKIGTLPMPRLQRFENGKTGYYKVNQGWVEDVILDEHGEVISRAKNIVIELLGENNDTSKAILSLLEEYKSLNRNDADYEAKKQDINQRFLALDRIKELIDDSITNYPSKNIFYVQEDKETGKLKVDTTNLFTHLTQLYNYIKQNNTATDAEGRKTIIASSIDAWYRNLYNTYRTIDELKKDEDLEVKILGITEGELVTNVPYKNASYQDCNLSGTVLNESTDARLTIVDPTNSTQQLISGKEPVATVNQVDGGIPGTSLTVYNKNGQATYVKAWGTERDAETVKQPGSNTEPIGDFTPIYKTCAELLRSTIYQHLENARNRKANTIDFTNKLYDLLYSMVRVKGVDNYIPLFNPKKGSIRIEKIDFNGITGISIVYQTPGTVNEPGIIQRFNIETNTKKGRAFGYIVKLDTTTKGRSDKNKAEFLYDSTSINVLAANAAQELVTFLVNRCSINISATGIEMDNLDVNSSRVETMKGFIRKVDTQNGPKVVVHIPDSIHPNHTRGKVYHREHNSYNEWLLKNSLVRVNVGKTADGKNFDKNTVNMRARQNMFVQLPIASNRQADLVQPQSRTNEYIENTTDAESFEKAKEVLRDSQAKSEHAGVNLLQVMLGKDALQKFNDILTKYQLTSLLLPSDIYYDALMNTYDAVGNIINQVMAYTKGSFSGSNKRVRYRQYNIEEGKVTKHDVSAGTVVVGPHMLNMLASKNLERRKQGIRKLMHEQLHILIQENAENRKALLDKVKPIFEEFAKILANDLNNSDLNEQQRNVVTYLNKLFNANLSEETKLEEFIVESFTNEVLFNYLNSKEVENAEDNKKDNLWNKIINAILDFFSAITGRDWTIKDKTLLMKEFNAVRDAFGPTNISEATTIIEEETKNGNDITSVPPTNTNEETDDLDDILGDPEDIIGDIPNSSNTPIDYGDNFMAEFEESIDLTKDYTRNDSIDSFINQLDASVREKFRYGLENGLISTKCW